ncbi:MAG: aminomethyl-transferring glycine dehydrogenase subunit GcvPB, partial [Erysipelothrix sp.]|nr:aminomethyl-transferring glycine dehydrogenase subunit GcvPB [Erysipelothrix sp.]
MNTIFHKSSPGRSAFKLPPSQVNKTTLSTSREASLKLPELAEIDIVRHYTNLSKNIYSIDEGFYPLGSCTMKY